MPSRSHSAPGDLSYECDTSHVHLFKLHRGITSAIVQDICFSRHSQWVAIISSKGTCHIFVLNPSGSDAGLLPLNSVVALSVVSRIKYSSFGWLNTNSRTNSLEHILVYTPSGHVVQHELLPSVCTGSPESASRVQRASPAQVQEDDLRSKLSLSSGGMYVEESSNLPIHEDACLSVDINGNLVKIGYLRGITSVAKFEDFFSQKTPASFDHFHSTKATSEERFSMKCYHASAVGSYQANGKICQDIINCHSKPGSVESAESSEEIGSSKRMDNFHDSDHMNNSVKRTLYARRAGWRSTSQNGFTTQPVQTDITLNEQILSTGKSPVNFGFALLEEHCKAVADPKEEHLKKSDEGANGNHHLNSNNTEKLQGDEMVCGMVSFVGD
ncbi:Autophagy-related protein 18g [Raphanus sativus]|nr:Autophagy-related protein 18g [Raphanus sativus]